LSNIPFNLGLQPTLQRGVHEVNSHLFLLVVRGAVASLPAEQQIAVNAAADEIRAVLKKFGDPGRVALSVVTSEIVVEEEGK
jgi:hypothetical protein